FGVVSCANWEASWFGAYRHLATRDDLDAIVHLGDYLYEYARGEYGTGLRAHEPAHEIRTLADYRVRHGQYKTDPDLAALHARLPFICTWDDHESA
ncbi:alkaline phosphatase D family protein, partial [Nocardia farcinica]|uniref:alkaline phosphatase D family protein n=1 Tax=Nocardia farcinica TaxID=37329 RepID=UPI001894C68B